MNNLLAATPARPNFVFILGEGEKESGEAVTSRVIFTASSTDRRGKDEKIIR